MEKSFIRVAVVVACVTLAGCASHTGMHMSENTTTTNTTTMANNNVNGEAATNLAAIGGSVRSSMDNMDISKMSHALDKAPGKPTKWTNNNTGTTYTVTPTRAVTVNGNHFCRTYDVSAQTTMGNTQTSSGTACVFKGSWGEV